MNKKEYNILCIEDNTDNQILVSYYLKSLPYNLTFAEDGRTAVDLIEKDTYDLFLLDLHLPNGINGIDIAQKIRQSDLNKDKPIVVITAFGSVDESYADPSEFVDKILTKPIRKEPFIEALGSFLKN